MRRRVKTTLLLFFPILLSACYQSGSSEISVVKDLAYGSRALQKLDLCLPAERGGKSPVVVLVHGGGWRSKDKASLAQKCRDFAENGMAAATINYRLAPDEEWPAQIEDVQLAIRWLRSQSEEYNLDKDHIGALGKSAGGHLAALTGVTDTWNEKEEELKDYSSKTNCVVVMYGPTDMADLYAYADSVKNPKAELGTKVLTDLMGKTLEEDRALYEMASPVNHVSSDSASYLFAHGTADKLAPIEQSQKMVSRLKANGINAELLSFEGLGHGLQGLNQNEQAELFGRQLDFFRRCLNSV